MPLKSLNINAGASSAKNTPHSQKIPVNQKFRKTNCKTCNNNHCFVKQHTTPEWLSVIDSKKSQSLYKKGYDVIREDATVAGIYFIQQGRVKVLRTGWQGRQQIVRLANDSHIIGHCGYGGEIYPIRATAMDDSMICFVDNVTVNDAMMHNPKFALAMIMFYSRELRKTEIRMMYLGQMNVREKVAEALLLLKATFGINSTDSSLNVRISRQDIADIAGTTANRVTTQLNEFENEKLITRAKRKIIINNVAALRKIVSAFNVKQFFEQK